MSRLGRCFAVLTGVLLVAGLGAGVAVAAPPSNDTEAGAIRIGSLPFTHSMDTSDATTDGPRICSTVASVFYSFTPAATTHVQIDLIGSEYDTTLGVYTRSDGGEVKRVKCNDDRFGYASGVRFRAQAGVTYFVMVSQCCGYRGSGGGPLVLTATKVTNVDLEFAFQVTGGTVDPNTGIATITGTATCNARSVVDREFALRQLRQGFFVARGGVYLVVACTPDSPAEWSAEVDTETGIAFGTGPATLSTYEEDGYDGWRYVSRYDVPDVTITLQ